MAIKERTWLLTSIILIILALVSLPAMAGETEEAPDLSNAACFTCHSDPELSKKDAKGKVIPLFVDETVYGKSVHGANECVSCHQDITELPHPETLAKVDCGGCHSDESEVYANSSHGKAFAARAPEAPSCVTCHGNHDILPKSSSASRINPLHEIEICVSCHLDPKVAYKYHLTDGLQNYKESVHGRGVLKSGLLGSATCISCHTAHNVRSKSDPQSSIYWSKIPQLCGTCHLGILEDFKQSEHGQLWAKKSSLGPGCVSCHGSHGIQEPRTMAFQLGVPNTCAKCHSGRVPTYQDNFHGQVKSPSFMQAASCADCHTAHRNLSRNDPRSTVHPSNLQKTCGNCHGQVNAAYCSYDPHMNPRDPKQNPIIHYIWLFFRGAIFFTFGFFGVHYILWFQRSLVWHLRGEDRGHPPSGREIYVRRFTPAQIWVHVAVVLSFTTLSVTGFTIYFHSAKWAEFTAQLLGGISFMRYLHRVSAIITFGYAFFHVGYLAYCVFVKHEKHIFWGPGSMLPKLADIADFFRNMRWFVYLGPMPKFDRWTYWEKLEYLVEFWGVPVIGLSGLALWFPKFFTGFFPGWILNAAQVVHSYEAFLAAGYIFLFHFFVAHLRAESFPMDTTIFTGKTPLKRFEEERPLEYQRLVETHKLGKYLVSPPSRDQLRIARAFGFAAIVPGLLLILAILWSLLF